MHQLPHLSITGSWEAEKPLFRILEESWVLQFGHTSPSLSFNVMTWNLTVFLLNTKYCRTGNFRGIKILRFWPIGNLHAGNLCEFLDIHKHENFANLAIFGKFANISCFYLLLYSVQATLGTSTFFKSRLTLQMFCVHGRKSNKCGINCHVPP